MSFTKTKSGVGDGDAARIFSVVSDINQTPDPLIAEQHIFVFPAVPGSDPGGSPGSDPGGTPGTNPGGTPSTNPGGTGLTVGQSTKLPKKQSFGRARYSSKTPRVCKVTKKGKVTARKVGTCKVLAKAVTGKKRKTIKLTVS